MNPIIKRLVLRNGECDTIHPPEGMVIISAVFRARLPSTSVIICQNVDGNEIKDVTNQEGILFPCTHWFGPTDGMTLNGIVANKIGIRARDKGMARDQGQPPTDRIELDVCCLCGVIK